MKHFFKRSNCKKNKGLEKLYRVTPKYQQFIYVCPLIKVFVGYSCSLVQHKSNKLKNIDKLIDTEFIHMC